MPSGSAPDAAGYAVTSLTCWPTTTSMLRVRVHARRERDLVRSARVTSPRSSPRYGPTNKMRLTVLAWSAAGGAFVGLLAGILLFAIGALVGAALPPVARVLERLWWPGAVVCFVLLPIAGGVLGYLEGRLKL